MQIFDRLRERFGIAGQVRGGEGLAMAGKKNPWGSSGGKDSDGEAGGDAPSGDKPGDDGSDGGKPDGPRNPWLPGGGSGSGKRRSASIEDIFKGRGPEGPRRGGGGGGGSNFRFPERPGGKSWVPVMIVAGLAVYYLATGVHLVQAKEQGVIKTLGSYTETLSPGLHFRAPFPIQTVTVEDVQGVRQLNIPTSGERDKLILTGDQNLVDLSYIVRWNIKDLRNFNFELVGPEETVSEVAEAAMRATIAEKTLDQTFTGTGRAEIQLAVRERMQRTLDEYGAGINVLGVEVEKADPPGDVVEAFRDVSVAEQDADKARNQARGYAQQVLNTAEGEAEAFSKVYAQYRLAPEVTRQRLYYETMEKVLLQNDKTIVEAPGVTPYLPLPELRRRAEQPAQITVKPAQPQSGQRNRGGQ